MKRSVLAGVLFVALVAAVWWVRNGRDHPRASSGAAAPPASSATIVTAATAPASPGKPAPLLGETILRDYAEPNFPAENDLTLMSRLMENSLLLLKSAAHRPLSANEDWADLLRGQNGAQVRFLPEDHAALSGEGRLVDRWGTPLFFHALGAGRYEIRSAGPDRKLWTADDLHRNTDGSFRRGEELNAASLVEAATPGRPPATAP